MGQSTRTTKLLLDLGKSQQGGANTGKRVVLDATVVVLHQARADLASTFCWSMPTKSPNASLTTQSSIWRCVSEPFRPMSCSTGRKPAGGRHPPILVPCMCGISANASHRRRLLARRSVTKDARGEARSYRSSPANWEKSDKQAFNQ
jgi:hypothetical protein